MSGTTWSKFYWSDWQSDPALRLCSYAARGLWMDLLCIAAAHDPIGYVAVAGRALDETSIARLTGGQESEVRALLGELDRAGVFSRDRQGRIYSRRMVKDARKAATARNQGKEGGNPTIRRGTVPKWQRVRPYRRSDNPAKTMRIFERGGGRCHWCKTELVWESPPGMEGEVPNLFHVDHVIPVCDGGTNDEANLVSACASCNHARARIDWVNPSDTNPDSKGDTNPHKPEAISQKKDTVASDEPNATATAVRDREPWRSDHDFERLWSIATPEARRRAKSKANAWEAWRKARKLAEPASIIAGMGAYLLGDPDVKRTGGPGLQRWLADRTWENWGTAGNAPLGLDWSDDRWAIAVGIWRTESAWDERLGPEPGEPGCRVPKHLLIEPAKAA